MSLDNDVRKAFEAHQDDVRSSDTSWAGIETKIRRAHRRRVTFSATVALIVIATGAALLPRISVKDKGNGFTTPTPAQPSLSVAPSTKPTTEASITPSPAPVIPAGWQRRAGVQSAFQLAIPADWKGGWFEGTWDFEPKGLPGGAQDGDTFTVTVTVQPGNYDASSGPGAQATTINGNRALTWHQSATEIDYRIEWIQCPGYATECSSNFSTHTLIARLHATNETLWSTYEVTGLNVVHTLFGYDGTAPVHGTAPSAHDDPFTKAIVRFMDARVEGIGADELMQGHAADFYNKNGGLYDLNGNVATSYGVGRRTGSPSANFSVTIHYAGGSTRQELITLQRSNEGVAPVITNVCTGCD